MNRRSFVQTGLLSAPSLLMAQSSQQHQTRLIPVGTDYANEQHTLGFSKMFFKISSADTAGGLFIMEHDDLGKGGPYRHLHPAQDEWLYALEGEFRVEIGDQKFVLNPGDSVLMPRQIPHVWAHVGEPPGKLLIAFTPAGKMEEFFREFGRTGKLPTDPEVVRAYGLERVGPPLNV